MPSANADIENVKKIFEPFIRTREETTHIRKVLALHLGRSLSNAPPAEPLALVAPDEVKATSSTEGLQRDYLRALNANLKARAEYEAVTRKGPRPTTAPTQKEDHKSDPLADHLQSIHLQKRQQRLQTVLKYLDLLASKPAAAPDFLTADEVFRNAAPLPTIPQEVMTGLASDLAAPQANLRGLVDQLEKQVLRAKLLLRREEELLERIRSRSTVTPENVSEGAKFSALNATRDELIGWIEAELAKAGDGGDEDGQERLRDTGATDGPPLEERLAIIKKDYDAYVAARQSLLQLVSQPPPFGMRPKTDTTSQPSSTPAPSPTPAPYMHVLTPYLEQLLAISHEQKGLIAQKSHLSTTVARQLKDNSQVLDHVADESHLLPTYGSQGAVKAKPNFGNLLAAHDNIGASKRIEPWVFAADSAKLATLEVAAEKIDEGQLALEAAMGTIAEIERLATGPPEFRQQDQQEKGEEEDVWLAKTAPGNAARTRKHVDKKTAQLSGTAWDMIDGSLGLLKSDLGHS